MAYKDLTFLLFAKDMSATRGFEKVALAGDKMSKGVSGAMGLAGLAVAGLAVSITAKSVKMAADFQTATTRLVTDAGESAAALGKVSTGILDLSVKTGTSAQELATGMYYIESAGYHGAAGLNVLGAAAEGAKVGQADLKTVADALTTVMKDYGPAAGTATQATDALIATVSHGKTTLEDLAGSLHNVLPNAQALGIKLNDVLGALASMTQEGISADQATQNLNHTIVSLANPTSVMANEMASLGLNSTTVAAQLGKRGITGTLEELSNAIKNKMGPQGLVIENIMNNSANATALANAEYKRLPTTVQQTAAAFKAGTITQRVWNASLKNLAPDVRHLAQQWATSQKTATGFSKALSSGTGPMHTYTADLAKVTGGQVGLQVALHLTELHAKDVTANVKAIGKASRDTTKDVKDWNVVQGTFNQRMSESNAAVGKLGIEIGQNLLPALTFIAGAIPPIIDGFSAMGHWLKVLSGSDIPGFVTAFSGMGTNIVNGLTNGIAKGQGRANGAMLDLGGGMTSTFARAIQSHSPSKVFHQFGVWITQGLANGILGSTSQVASASSSLANVVKSAFTSGAIGSGTEHSLLSMISGDSKRLKSDSAMRAALQTKLSGLKTSRTGVHDATLAATLGAGNITGFGAPGDAVTGLRSLVGKTKTFTADLKALTKKGVAGTMLTQLVDGWDSDPDTALATANGLLANPTDLKQILSYQKQLDTAGRALGAYAGHAEYDSQINATSGRMKVETWAMQQLARSEAQKVGNAVHFHFHVSGTYAGTKEALAKSFTQLLRDEVKKGTIPKNWAAG